MCVCVCVCVCVFVPRLEEMLNDFPVTLNDTRVRSGSSRAELERREAPGLHNTYRIQHAMGISHPVCVCVCVCV